MKSTIVLVADSAQARLFTLKSASSKLNEFETLVNPESRLHEQDLTSDLPGKDSGRGGAGGHAYQNQTEPKEQLTIDFAKRVAKRLEKARAGNEIKRLLIVSAPGFLGQLRNQFSGQIAKLVSFELAKNLTTHSVDEIRQHLPKYLATTL